MKDLVENFCHTKLFHINHWYNFKFGLEKKSLPWKFSLTKFYLTISSDRFVCELKKTILDLRWEHFRDLITLHITDPKFASTKCFDASLVIITNIRVHLWFCIFFNFAYITLFFSTSELCSRTNQDIAMSIFLSKFSSKYV